MKFYAEFETDRIIREKLFPDYSYNGLMIEVGGASPEFLSMSKHFKDSGWRTVIVEPNPNFVNEHKKMENEVYQYACSFENRFGEFTIVKQNEKAYGGTVTDHSFSSIKPKDSYIDKHKEHFEKCEKEIIKVEIIKLENLISKLNIKKIDIISIDVEGWELEVMMGLDTNKIDCSVFVIENYLNDYSYNEYFDKIGYKLFEEINYNQIYVKK